MKQYIGTKIVQAEPQTSLAAGFGAAGPGKDGYRVIYPDGFVSWSPKDTFEEAYRPADGMSFGLAIEALKKGERVARAGWNGKGMWLYRVNGNSNFSAVTYEHLPFIAMKTADNKVVPWLASQTDMLADDWQIVGEVTSCI